jgi:hypothetical protein
VLYLSYFHWGELAPQAAIRLVAADVLPELETEMDLIAAEPLAASATFASPPAARVAVPAVASVAVPAAASVAVPAAASVAVPAAASVAVPAAASVAVPAAAKEPPSPRREVVDPCSSLGGLEALQCKRCGDKRGVAWLLCQERARLEYCEGRSAGEALCPSAIPAARTDHVPPG